MKHRPPPPCRGTGQRPPRRRQRGVTLFVVIVFVLLSMLLALWASRTALFNELVVGNDADYQRAFEAAQALVQDAELDIRGESADGNGCTPDTNDDKICRQGATVDKFPLESKDVGPMLAELELLSTRCRHGICAKRLGRQDFWNYVSTHTPAPSSLQTYEVGIDQLSAAGIGARYGQYTGAKMGDSSAPANPLLRWNASTPWNRGGWYWIEMLPYTQKASSVVSEMGPGKTLLTIVPLNTLPGAVYRITAVAYGRKPGTVVVLQETYARTKHKD